MGVIGNFDSLCLEYSYQKSSLEELKRLGDDALGKKVYIESHLRSCYKGVISYIFDQQIWLENACITNTGTPIFSILNLFFSDVLHIAVCGVDKQIRKRILDEIYGEKGAKQYVAKPLLPRNIAEEESTDTLFEINPSFNDLPPTEYREEIIKSVHLPRPYARMPRPSRWFIIDDMSNFNKAILDIKKESTIGLSAQDGSVGRKGSLVWLAVATSRNVFLIDIVTIGIDNALRSGLEDIMKDTYITKIISGGEFLEDFFYHQHNFQMGKVSIPEVQDVYLCLKEGKDMPSIYKDFKLLLKQNLEIGKNHVPHLYSNVAHDLDWRTRPLPGPLCQYLFESVVLLRELNQSLLDCLLLPLNELFKMHLGCLKEKDAYGAERYERSIVPPAIQNSTANCITILSKMAKVGYKNAMM